MSLDINRYDVSAMANSSDNCSIICCGSSGSGKSVLIKDLMYQYHMAGVPRCVVFSGTEIANGFFSQFVPKLFVHCPASVAGIKAVLDHQKDLYLKRSVGEIPLDTDLRLLFIADDLAYDRKLINSPTLLEIFNNGRHYGIIFIMSIQYFMHLSVGMRTNARLAFFCKENNPNNRKRIFDNFGGAFSSLELFDSVCCQLTEEHHVMVIDKRSARNELKSTTFWYKATHNLDFKFGAASFWKHHDRNYLSVEEEYLHRKRRQTGEATSGPLRVTRLS